MRIKTGECNYRDDAGALWCAVSYIDDTTGNVTTEDVFLESADTESGLPRWPVAIEQPMMV